MRKCYTTLRMKKVVKKMTQKHWWLIGAFFIGLVLIGLGYFSSSQSSYIKEKVTGVISPPICLPRRLDGVCVKTEAEQNSEIVAVMIENHPVSRPQAGLAEASVVYEAQVEGNYTRFLALFPANIRDGVVTTTVAKVGPVRSARPYYLDWVAEYGRPLYMHVGGSPDALKIITARKMWDANEFYFGSSYWRSGDRSAPHNAYTSNHLWERLLKNEPNNFTPWAFAIKPACVSNCVKGIRIDYLKPDFVTVWKFVSTTERYERWQNDEKHLTETGAIMADTIVIQEVPSTVVDEEGRLEMATLGSGNAFVITKGNKISGTWNKKTATDRTRFVDSSGQEIPLNPGKIWVQVVPRLSIVSFVEYD